MIKNRETPFVLVIGLLLFLFLCYIIPSLIHGIEGWARIFLYYIPLYFILGVGAIIYALEQCASKVESTSTEDQA